MPDRLSDTDVELFGSLLAFAQRLTLRVDEQLASFRLTSRQWLLLAVLARRFPGHAPTLSEATAVFGTSRQNVKQIVRQLERNGWLTVQADPSDRRAQRLVLTERIATFDEPEVRAVQAAFVRSVLGGLARPERQALLEMLSICLPRLAEPALAVGGST